MAPFCLSAECYPFKLLMDYGFRSFYKPTVNCKKTQTEQQQKKVTTTTDRDPNIRNLPFKNKNQQGKLGTNAVSN